MAYIAGTSADDILNGTASADTLYGDAGNDTLYAGNGNDTLRGGTGADTMYGGIGNDYYYVDDVNDVVVELSGEGSDRVYTTVSYVLASGVSVEYVEAEGATSIDLTGNELANSLKGNAAANVLSGGGGDDSLSGGGGNDTLYGEDGADSLYGGDGDDTLYGGAGNDSFSGGTGLNTLSGGLGDDYYEIWTPTDVIVESAGEGNDTLLTFSSYVLQAGVSVENLWAANNTSAIDLTGNEFGNSIYGNAANNTLAGGDGNDSLQGRDGNDVLYGGAGSDWLTGDNGDDRLVGGGGIDALVGGAGSDVFVFAELGSDGISDFASGADRIELQTSFFSALTAGALSSSAFVIGSAAGDADDRIVYNKTTGALYYDVDGVGGLAMQRVADLNPGTTLVAADFLIV